MLTLNEWLLAGASTSWMTPAQTALLTLGLLIAGAVVISGRRRAKDRQNSPQAYVRERTRRIEEERRVAEDVEAVMIRLEQLAREVEAQVNEQLARLESATRAADERIRELNGSAPSARSKTTPSSPSIDITVDDPIAPPAAARPGAPRSVERRESPAQSIARLAAGGKSPRQIARELSKSLGEVELTLAVERAKGEASPRVRA